ncbi:MAG: AAA family ATPase [Isosphaeraceae bacterium]
MAESKALKLKVTEALPKDMGRGLARLDPADMARLGLEVGDIVALQGKRLTVGKAMPAYKEHRDQSRIQIDGVTRENAGAAIDQVMEASKAAVRPAERVVLTPLGFVPADRDLDYIGSLFDGLPVIAEDRVRATLFGNRSADFKVASTTPSGPVVIKPRTVLEISRSGPARSKGQGTESDKAQPISYEDIGGLKREMHRIREIVGAPVPVSRGVLPPRDRPAQGRVAARAPGCGKTLHRPRAVAHETDARFFTVNGPGDHSFYGESEAYLRKIFDEATRQVPSIIFLDEIDAIAPLREGRRGRREAGGRRCC